MAYKRDNPSPAQMEQEWEAEEDARALTRAAEVNGSKSRKKRARKAAEKQLREAKERERKVAEGLKKAFPDD